MKKSILNSSLCILFMLISSLSFSQEKLLVAGSGWPQIATIDKTTGEIEWSYTLEKGTECNDIEQVGNKKVLISYSKGAKLITKKHKEIWNFPVEQGEQLFTATELDNGNFLLGVCANPIRLITLNSKGKKIHEQNFDLEVKGVHGQFRQILPTKNGTYLIPILARGEVIELSKSNKVLKRIKVDGNPFSAKILANGNWIVACGDAHKLVIIDPKKEEVIQTISNDDVKGAELLFVAEVHQLENGNILFANWNGHSKDKSAPKIIEIDKNNKVVWTLPNNENIKNISAIGIQ
jgi:hypothetical protein